MKIGTKVTNSKGWTGTVVERPKHWNWKSEGSTPVVYVHWKEREEAMRNPEKRGVPINDPVISNLPEELTVIS